jgi:hypothetical protein
LFWKKLEVGFLHLEIRLRVQASRACIRRFFCFDYETAVSALPESLAVFFENFVFLNIFQKG